MQLPIPNTVKSITDWGKYTVYLLHDKVYVFTTQGFNLHASLSHDFIKAVACDDTGLFAISDTTVYFIPKSAVVLGGSLDGLLTVKYYTATTFLVKTASSRYTATAPQPITISTSGQLPLACTEFRDISVFNGALLLVAKEGLFYFSNSLLYSYYFCSIVGIAMGRIGTDCLVLVTENSGLIFSKIPEANFYYEDMLDSGKELSLVVTALSTPSLPSVIGKHRAKFGGEILLITIDSAPYLRAYKVENEALTAITVSAQPASTKPYIDWAGNKVAIAEQADSQLIYVYEVIADELVEKASAYLYTFNNKDIAFHSSGAYVAAISTTTLTLYSYDGNSLTSEDTAAVSTNDATWGKWCPAYPDLLAVVGSTQVSSIKLFKLDSGTDSISVIDTVSGSNAIPTKAKYMCWVGKFLVVGAYDYASDLFHIYEVVDEALVLRSSVAAENDSTIIQNISNINGFLYVNYTVPSDKHKLYKIAGGMATELDDLFSIGDANKGEYNAVASASGYTLLTADTTPYNYAYSMLISGLGEAADVNAVEASRDIFVAATDGLYLFSVPLNQQEWTMSLSSFSKLFDGVNVRDIALLQDSRLGQGYLVYSSDIIDIVNLEEL